MSRSAATEIRHVRHARRGALVALGAGLLLAASTGACSTGPAATPTATPPPATAAPEMTPEPSLVVETDSPPAPSPSPLDPCALITRDEANALAGVVVQDPEPAGQPPVRCVWPTPVTGTIGQVEIDVGDGAKKSYDIDATTLEHDFATIADLGDEAYAEDGAIFFRKGDTWVAIHLVSLDDPAKTAAKLEALARAVADRL